MSEHKFKTFSEYLIAVKNASEGNRVDSRLIRICKKPESFSNDELMKMEMFAELKQRKNENQ